MAPQVGFEPTTDRLTADCSTTELLWNNLVNLSFCNSATFNNIPWFKTVVNRFRGKYLKFLFMTKYSRRERRFHPFSPLFILKRFFNVPFQEFFHLKHLQRYLKRDHQFVLSYLRYRHKRYLKGLNITLH